MNPAVNPLAKLARHTYQVQLSAQSLSSCAISKYKNNRANHSTRHSVITQSAVFLYIHLSVVVRCSCHWLLLEPVKHLACGISYDFVLGIRHVEQLTEP